MIGQMNVKNLYETDYVPRLNLHQNQEVKYHMQMHNLFLDSKGQVTNWQNLESDYRRVVVEADAESYVFNDFFIENLMFSSMSRQEPMHWTFGENYKLPYFLMDNKFELVNGPKRYEILKQVEERVNLLWNSLDKFPKLSSAYLFIMQIYDIISFESFTSGLTGKSLSSLIIGKPFEVEKISNTESSLGVGLYGKDSMFKNGLFYICFMGYTYYMGKWCAMFNYRCDESKVKMTDEKLNTKREGSSYYSGTLIVEMETWSIALGTMNEDYIAVQNKHGIRIKRNINLSLV